MSEQLEPDPDAPEIAAKGDVTSMVGGDQNIYGDAQARFKFTKLSDRKPGQAWMLLYYGATKTGKTEFGGSAGPRTLFLNVGEGIETLLAPGFRKRHPDSKDMIVIDIRETNPKGVSEAFAMMNDALDHALKYFPDKFDTVVLDEATAYRRFALNNAMSLNSAQRTTIRGNRNTEFVKADVTDYGVEMAMVEWFLGTYTPKFKEANKNFLMLAHERQLFGKPKAIGDEPPLRRILPGFTGQKFPDFVPAYFDDVWRSEVINGGRDGYIYRARTAGSEMEVAGSRHGGVFEALEKNPNYLKLLERIRSSNPQR